MEAEASEVASRLRSLYGTTELLRAGVVHVTAVARSAQGPLRVLKIDASSPKSESDFFVLNLCRARADAILTDFRRKLEPQKQVGFRRERFILPDDFPPIETSSPLIGRGGKIITIQHDHFPQEESR